MVSRDGSHPASNESGAMSDAHGHQRQCPTRTDGRVALFTHRVTEPECQSRQRGMFHRCFSCAYNNTWVARYGLPEGAEEVVRERQGTAEGSAFEASAGDGPEPLAARGLRETAWLEGRR